MWIKMDGVGGYRPLESFVTLQVGEVTSGLWRVRARATEGGSLLDLEGDYTSENDAQTALFELLQQVGLYSS